MRRDKLRKPEEMGFRKRNPVGGETLQMGDDDKVCKTCGTELDDEDLDEKEEDGED